MIIWNVASSTTFFKVKYFCFWIFGGFLGFVFFFTVESRFLELDGDATNYEDSRYRGGKYRKKQKTNKPI